MFGAKLIELIASCCPRMRNSNDHKFFRGYKFNDYCDQVSLHWVDERMRERCRNCKNSHCLNGTSQWEEIR